MEMTEEMYLQQYDKDMYEKPSLTVDLVPFKVDLNTEKLQVLLYKRNEFPYKNYYSLLGGFVGIEKTIEETVQTVLTKYTGMSDLYFEQLPTVSTVDRDKRMRIISEPFTALLKSNESIVCNDGLELFNIEYGQETTEEGSSIIKVKLVSETTTLENTLKVDFEKVGKIQKARLTIIENSLAFDHIKIIVMALNLLKQKISTGFNPLLVNMMDEKFTFKDLKKSMEIILDGKEINYKTLQSRLSPYLIKTDEMIKLGAFRPASLFKFDETVNEKEDNLIFY